MSVYVGREMSIVKVMNDRCSNLMETQVNLNEKFSHKKGRKRLELVKIDGAPFIF